MKFLLIFWLFAGWHNLMGLSYDWNTNTFRGEINPQEITLAVIAGPILTLGYTYAYIDQRIK